MFDIFHLPPATADRKEILNYKFEKNFKPGRINLVLTVDGHSLTFRYLRLIATSMERPIMSSDNTMTGTRLVFPTTKSQSAFVNAYYLFQFLINEATLGDDLTTMELDESLNVSPTLRGDIAHALQLCKVLYIDKSEHHASVNEMLNAMKSGETISEIKTFTYPDFDQFVFSSAVDTSPSRLPLKLSYTLPETLWKKLSDAGFSLPDKTPLASYITSILPKIPDKSLNNNKITLKNGSIYVYVAPYSLLELDCGKYTIGEVRKHCDIRRIKQFIEGRNNDVKFSSGRLYHAFHQLPRWARKNLLRYKGSPLVEAMDVHNAFFVLLAKIFRTVPSIDRAELSRYEDIVCRGVLYEDVMKFTGDVDRDSVKESLNAYKNESASRMKRYEVHRFFESIFPSITNFLENYPTYTKEGKTVKFIQKDASYIETVLMSRVCAALAAHGATPFSLHDAVYVSTDDKAMLDAKSVDVEAIFWRAYRGLTEDDTKLLIDISRAS